MSDKKSPMPSKLPLDSARVFVITARLGSFRDAATNLGLSPSAVSRHITNLEQWLGQPLFERGVRRVDLLHAGRTLAAALDESIQQTEQALEKHRHTRAGRIRLTTLPFFANHWLVDQLHDLPSPIKLSIDTTSLVQGLDGTNFDIAVRNLKEPPIGVASTKLLDLRLVPVCHPKLARRLRAPEDLLRAPLIHLSARPGGWQRWFSQHKLENRAPTPVLEVDNLPAALEAAAQGHGVALGLSPIMWSGESLQCVVPFKSAPVDGGSYYIAMRQEDRVRPDLELLSKWIKGRLARQRDAMLRREQEATLRV